MPSFEVGRTTGSLRRRISRNLAAVVFVFIGVAGAVSWEPTIEPASVERMAFPPTSAVGDEIRTDQLLPLRDRKADVASAEIVLRRSNWLE
jgi:hypothetical protein